jgi:hypothetical protein
VVLSQQDCEAEGSLSREVPGWVEAALTKPGRPRTARWGGSGKRGGKAYERNRRLTLLNLVPAQTWWIWAGGDAYPFLMTMFVGDQRRGTPGRTGWVGREAVMKCCGVAMAMSLEQSRVPPPSSDQRMNTGTEPGLPRCRTASADAGLGTSSADRPGSGRSRRSSPRPGEPVTWRRTAVVSRRESGGCNAERCDTEW